jgi:hypothetical protein
LAPRSIRKLILESGEGPTSWLTNSRLQSLAKYEYTGDTHYPLKRTASRLFGGNSNFQLALCSFSWTQMPLCGLGWIGSMMGKRAVRG